MKISGVIFDLDGTLIKYAIDRESLTYEMFRFLKSLNLFFNIYSINDYPITIIRKTRNILKSMGLCKPLIQEVTDELFRMVNQYEIMACENTSIFDGVYESLKLVKSLNLMCGLFTLCGRASTECVLSKFNLKNYFDAVVTRDDVKNFKPHPEHLLKVISSLNIPPTETIVVGDSTLDIISARGVNAFPVAVKTGVRRVEELRASGAEIILNSIADFPDFLKNFLLST